jgi:hypothetical protein
MAHIYPARTADISLTTGLGPISVTGVAPAINMRTFNQVMQIGDSVYLGVVHRDKNEWEEGLYTYVGVNRFARNVILQSSGGGTPVNFSAGIKDVFATIPSLSVQRGDENVAPNGIAEIDFGAWPGKPDTSLSIIDPNIVADSIVIANVNAITTVDHDADEVWIDPPIIVAGNIIQGVGFTIYAMAREDVLYGKYKVSWLWK